MSFVRGFHNLSLSFWLRWYLAQQRRKSLRLSLQFLFGGQCPKVPFAMNKMKASKKSSCRIKSLIYADIKNFQL